MPFTLTCNNTEEQINAVATLMFHCGVALDMDYNIGGSGSSGGTLESSFLNFFKYKNTVNFTSRSRKTSTYNSVTNEWDFTPYTEEEWKEILRTEINARRPIIYTGCNPEVCHAFIYDGYDASDNFHFNWGWGGSCDSYYTINTLSPGSGGTGSDSGTYNQSQNAVIGIEPVFDAAPIVDFLLHKQQLLQVELSILQNNALALLIHYHGHLKAELPTQATHKILTLLTTHPEHTMLLSLQQMPIAATLKQ